MTEDARGQAVQTLSLAVATLGLLLALAAGRLASVRRPWTLVDFFVALCLMVWGSSTAMALLAAAAPGPVDLGARPGLWATVGGSAVGGLLSAGFALARAARGRQLDRLGLRPGPPWGWPLALALGPPLVLLSAAWVHLLQALGRDVSAQQLMDQVLLAPGAPAARAAIVDGVLLAPPIEELLFRGLLLVPLAERLGRGRAILLSSLLFGLMHVADPDSVVPLVLIGIALGWLRLRTGSLGPPVLLHALNNTLAFALGLSGAPAG